MTRAPSPAVGGRLKSRLSGIAAAFLGVFVGGCGESVVTPPAPTPDPKALVIPTQRTGPVQVQFVDSSVPPGSTLAGCGSLIAGCKGKLRMAFDLLPQSAGHALRLRVYVHDASQIACLWGETGSFDLRAGVPARLAISFDSADRCATPVTVVAMDAIVEGPVEVASRQEWTLSYEFTP